jgi:diketogulonate reductase-like aldo/keto reductase
MICSSLYLSLAFVLLRLPSRGPYPSAGLNFPAVSIFGFWVNLHNVAQRGDDQFIDDLVTQAIAYVPYFPLGGFSPLQSAALDAASASVQATPKQVALAWLLQRAPNILLIPGTSSVGHLRENLAAATLELPAETIAELDRIAIAASHAT